ncbi:Uncharacterised protein [Serratia rubidaea]|uniref:Uncharacterized protein n=1 Tax=Serratia rubidaea TaxID=61652 RepID=A0A447QQA2_SERRU|nr:hypothetical protein D781_0998 [Serratia sp. FGI94]VEA72163.1 Uncharacterised protein [Serratia rubidaea]VTP60754.1 Uncharacterised protein [Serratia rubidaea]
MLFSRYYSISRLQKRENKMGRISGPLTDSELPDVS